MLSVTLIGAKCKQTQYLMDKAILGKMCGVYVACVVNVDKGQLCADTLTHVKQEGEQIIYLNLTTDSHLAFSENSNMC